MYDRCPALQPLENVVFEGKPQAYHGLSLLACQQSSGRRTYYLIVGDMTHTDVMELVLTAQCHKMLLPLRLNNDYWFAFLEWPPNCLPGTNSFQFFHFVPSRNYEIPASR